MKTHIKRTGLKILKWLGIFIGAVLLLLFLIPLLFPGEVSAQVKALANKSLATEINFSKSRLSFFTHFPSLTVSLDSLSLKGSAPYSNDTLLKADQVSFGINLKRLIFDNEVSVDELYVSDATINVRVNEKGEVNYNVYIPPAQQPKDTLNQEGTAIKLDRIDLENCRIRYNDRSAKILVDAYGFNYLGKGAIDEDVFDLATDAEIDSVDFYYDRIPYLQRKNIRADLITQINTNSLSFILRKNELRINQLPIEFTGKFSVVKEGFDIDLNATSENSRLKDMFSILPPEYLKWLEDTDVDGRADLRLTYQGHYRPAAKRQPSLGFNLKVRDGRIEYKDAPEAVEDLNMNLTARVPQLDVERMEVLLKQFDFKLGENDGFHAYLQSKGLTNMAVKASIGGSLDLKQLDDALGIKDIAMRGRLKTNIVAEGIYNAQQKLFPKTKGSLSLQNGWLKSDLYPNAITDIKFIANATNNAGTFSDLKVAVTPFSFVFEGNPVFVNAAFSNFEDIAYDIRAKGELNIGRIYKVFSQKGLDVEGYAKADFTLQGKQSYAATGQYDKLNNRGTLLLRNIKATSELFPKPFLLREGHFTFQNEKMWFDKFKAAYGKSDFAINGYLLNTINYFLESRGTLHGDFNMKSKLINADEFMALEEGENTERKAEIEYAKEDNPKMTGVFLVPANLDVSLIANADKVQYTGLVLNNLIGRVKLSKGKISLENTTFNIIGSTVGIDASYDDEGPLAAHFDAHFRVKDFSVQRAYKEIPMFREMVTAAENAAGIIGVDYTISGDLNGNMAPIYESLKGGGTINVHDVKVSGLKLFGGVSSKTGSEKMNNPNLKGIVIKTSIKDNLVYIDDFAFSVAGFRPKIEGTTSFDGKLDLRMRLGLPPGGLLGIPIMIRGTHEKPEIEVFSKTYHEITPAVYNELKNKVVRKSRRNENKEPE